MSTKKPTIGKFDKADFPLFELFGVKVKVDSGAYTSTIHCSSINVKENELEVVFLAPEEAGFTGKKQIFKDYTSKKVRSSSGEQQKRFIIKGEIILFNQKYITEFTLSDRALMRYPVLLGRKLLSNNFVIDTSLADLSVKNKNRKDL